MLRAALNPNILRRSVEDKTVNRFHFLRLDNGSRFQIFNADFSGVIRVENTVVRAHIRAAVVRHFESDSRKRFIGGSLDIFVNHQHGKRLIVERHGICRADLNFHTLGSAVQGVAAGGFYLAGYNRCAGIDTGNRNSSVGIGHKLAELIAAPVRHKKRHAGERRRGSRHILCDGDGLFRDVGKRQSLRFGGFQFHRLRRVVQNVSVRGNGFFHHQNAGIQPRQQDFPVAVRGINPVGGKQPAQIVHIFSVRSQHLESRAGQGLKRHAVPLDNFQRRLRGIVERQGLRPALLNGDGLRGSVQNIAGERLCLHDGHSLTGRQTGHHKLPVCVRGINAVGGSELRPPAVRHEKLHAGERIGGSRCVFLHGKGLLRFIANREGLRVVRVNRHSQGRRVQNVAIRDCRFRQRIDAGFHFGNQELSVGIRPVNPVGGSPAAVIIQRFAAGGRGFELRVGNELSRHAVQLADADGTFRGVIERQNLRRRAAPHPGGLRSGIQNIALRGLDFLHHHAHAGSEVREDKPPVFIGCVAAGGRSDRQAVAVCDEEPRPFQRRRGSRHILLHGQRRQRLVVKQQFLRAVRADGDGLRPVRFVDHIAGNRGKLRHRQCSRHAGQQDFSRRVRGEIAVGIGGIVGEIFSAGSRNMEHDTGERLSRHAVQLADF